MGWEYETLFDVEDIGAGKLTPLEAQARIDNPERWKFERSSIRTGSMGYRTRTTKAGTRLEAEIYPLFGREQEKKARAARKSLTPEKIQRHNDAKSQRKLVQLIEANFTKEDIHIGLSFEGTAPGWKQTQKQIQKFLRKVRREREKRGLPDLKYIYAMEDGEEGREKRIHAHVIMNGGIDRQELEQIWGHGFANADSLQPDRKDGLEAIARYIWRQNTGMPREKSRRKWSSSKNLIKPKTRTSDTKMSNGKVKRLSRSFDAEAKEIMEKVYPGYEFVRSRVRYSDVVDGVYIRVLMRRKE